MLPLSRFMSIGTIQSPPTALPEGPRYVVGPGASDLGNAVETATGASARAGTVPLDGRGVNGIQQRGAPRFAWVNRPSAHPALSPSRRSASGIPDRTCPALERSL